MRVEVITEREQRHVAWAPFTVRLGDKVLLEGNPLRLGDRAVEAIVVHIGPGSPPARRVLAILEHFGSGPYGEPWDSVEMEVELTDEEEEGG